MESFFFALMAGFVATVLGTAFHRIFTIRQLYILPLKFFEYGIFQNNNERIFEFRIINRSIFNEENIIVYFPKNINCELVGTDHPRLCIEGNKIAVDRITKLSEVSILLLLKGESSFSDINIDCSSNASKGKVVKKAADVPINYGILTLLLSVFILLLIGLCYNFYRIDSNFQERISNIQKQVQDEHKEKIDKIVGQNRQLLDLGWNRDQIYSYMTSDLAKCYSKEQLPIFIKDVVKDHKKFKVVFGLDNKTIHSMSVVIAMAKTNDNASLKLLTSYGKEFIKPHEYSESSISYEITEGIAKYVFFDTYCTVNGEIFTMTFQVPVQ